MLIIAGGSGAGWTLPFILAFLRKVSAVDTENATASPPSLKVILATRDLPTKRWYETEVQRLVVAASRDQKTAIEVEVYFTGASDNAEESKAAGQFLQRLDEREKAPDALPAQEVDNSDSSSKDDFQPLHELRHLESRPDLPAIIHQEASSAGPGNFLGVFVSFIESRVNSSIC
jgi:hypothetical protein